MPDLGGSPLLTTPLPKYPWQVVATDLFELHGVHYLLIADYFSCYPEVSRLTTTTSAAVITAMKAVFTRHGIPEVLHSANGPQYSSHEFAVFGDSYGFQHSTSSPLYPQSNGQTERMAQTAKRLMTNSSDPINGFANIQSNSTALVRTSPAKLCMRRQIRTTVPQPLYHNGHIYQSFDEEMKERQKVNFDHRHRTRKASEIPDHMEVWVNSGPEPVRGTVTAHAEQPYSYFVSTPTGELHRNRSQLNIIPPTNENTPNTTQEFPNTLQRVSWLTHKQGQ